jgi:hypothetical protein
MYEEKDREARLGSLHTMRASNLDPLSHSSISIQDAGGPNLTRPAEPSPLPIRMLGPHPTSRPALDSHTPGPRQTGLPPRPREIALVDRPRPKTAQAPSFKPQPSAVRAGQDAVQTDAPVPARLDSESSDLDDRPAGHGSPPASPHADSMTDGSGMSSDLARAECGAVGPTSQEPPTAMLRGSGSLSDEDLEAMPFLAHEDHEVDLDMLEDGPCLPRRDSHSHEGHASPGAIVDRMRHDGAPAAVRAGAAHMLSGAADPPSLNMSSASADGIEACCSSSLDGGAAAAVTAAMGDPLNAGDAAAVPWRILDETAASHSGMDSNLDGSLGSDQGPGFPFFTGAGDCEVSVMPDESDVLGFSGGPALGWHASPHLHPGLAHSGNSDSAGPTVSASSDDAGAQAAPSSRLYSPRCTSPQGGLWHLDGSVSSADRGFGGGSDIHVKQTLHVQGLRGSIPLASSMPSTSVSASSDEGSLGAFTGQPTWVGSHERASHPSPAGRGISGGKPLARTAYAEENLGHEHVS